MPGVSGEHVGAHHQQPDGAPHLALRSRQIFDPGRDPARGGLRGPGGPPARGRRGRLRARGARVVEAHLGILEGRRRLDPPAQGAARTVGVAVDQEADHVHDVAVGARQPVLHGQEVGAHVLRGSRDEAQDLGDAAQHRHLLRARGRVPAAAAELLEARQQALLAAVHLEAAHAREAHDARCGHAADHGVALLAPGLEPGKDRLDVVFHEEHVGDDDVALGDVPAAALERLGIVAPLGGDVEAEREVGQVMRQDPTRPLDGSGQVTVQGDDDDAHGRRISGRSGLSHRRVSRR